MQTSLFKLRDYQGEACTSTARALGAHRRALLVAPTASGKTAIIGEFCKRIKAADPEARILVLCHQGHLLTQNEAMIHRVCGVVDTGVYCADQGRKEHWNEIVLASRDSLGRNPEICGQFKFIICDEAHMIDPKCLEEKNETNYAKIFKAQREYYCIGLTGTPWRLGNGHLVGKDTFFQVTSYEIKMDYLIEEGYLTPYTLPVETKTIIDTSGLEVKGGDFREKDLEEVSSSVQIIDECLDVWEEKAADRVCSIFFCCSKIHAGKVKELLGRRISPSLIAYIDGDLTGHSRVELLKDIRAGKYRAIVNISVLSVGADFPIIDCVVFLRATTSAALYVQMAGRGLRLYPGKKDCLMLDLAGNFDRFKSLSEPYIKKKRGQLGDGEGGGNGAPVKTCPACGYETSSAASQCEKCFHIFISHTQMAKLGGYELTYKVERTHFEEYETRAGEKCVKVHYKLIDGTVAAQYLLIYRQMKWADRHRKLWKQLENINYQPELVKITKKPGSKYENVEVIRWRERKGMTCCDWVESQHSLISYQTTVICVECGEPI